MNEVNIKKILGQIEKQVEVIKAYYHSLDDIIYQIAGLFKINQNYYLKNVKYKHY